jgi:alkylated DNA repair dioxygenase AlkB
MKPQQREDVSLVIDRRRIIAGLTVVRHFVHDHAAYLAALIAGMTWQQRSITLYGREVMQPRLIAWAGEAPYSYSGDTLRPKHDDCEALSQLRADVDRHVGKHFNHVLLNRYRDGRDSIGMHADDESGLVTRAPIVSLSLGARRRLKFRPKPFDHGHTTAGSLSLNLGEGDLLVMHGRTQEFYSHGIDKAGGDIGERISVTFRRVRT